MSARAPAVLAVNAGSSSLKFALYPHVGGTVEAAFLSGCFEGLEPGGTPMLGTRHGDFDAPLATGGSDSVGAAPTALARVPAVHAVGIRIEAIAHRIVHGGERYAGSVLLDDQSLAYLATLAPLHQPHNLDGVLAFARSYPGLAQIGCFDTAFHASLPEVERTFALPQSLRRAAPGSGATAFMACPTAMSATAWPSAARAHEGGC